MKFVIDPELLAKEMASLVGVIENKPAMGSHNYVLVEAYGKHLKLTVTNGVVTIDAFVKNINPEEGLEMCVPARKLLELSKTFHSGELTVRRSDDGHVHLTHGPKAKYKLSSIAPSLFPRIEDKFGPAFDLPAATFKSFVKLTRGFIGEDDSQHTYAGGLLEFPTGKLRMTSTDNLRLAMAETDWSHNSPVGQVLLPHKTLIELGKILSGYETFQMSVSSSIYGVVQKVRFRAGNKFLTSNLTNGEFPNTAMLLDDPTSLIELDFNRQELNDAIKRILLTSEERNRIVQMSLGESSLAFSTDGLDAGADQIDYSGCYFDPSSDGELNMGLNGDFIAQFLAVAPEAMDGDDVQIKYSGMNRFVELRPAKAKNINFRYLVAPTRSLN